MTWPLYLTLTAGGFVFCCYSKMQKDEVNWCKECQSNWFDAHEAASECDTVGVLAALLLLVVSLQACNKCLAPTDIIPHINRRLRANDSQIFLFAQPTAGDGPQAQLPVIAGAWKHVHNALFVQLENEMANKQAILMHWSTKADHEAALTDCGFLTDQLSK